MHAVKSNQKNSENSAITEFYRIGAELTVYAINSKLRGICILPELDAISANVFHSVLQFKREQQR